MAFYQALGFRPVQPPEGIAGRAVWLGRAATQIHLMPRDGAEGSRGDEVGGGQSDEAAGGQSDEAGGEQSGEIGGRQSGGIGDARPGHFAVVVDRYEATVERLQADGHSVEPRRAHWGSPRSYVRDPAGYLVELIAWPPGGG